MLAWALFSRTAHICGPINIYWGNHSKKDVYSTNNDSEFGFEATLAWSKVTACQFQENIITRRVPHVAYLRLKNR